jgi:hypothetical protein
MANTEVEEEYVFGNRRGASTRQAYTESPCWRNPEFHRRKRPYEEPESPGFVVDSSVESVGESTERLLSFFEADRGTA